MKQKTAIIIGATGLTGRILLDTLLTDNNFGAIKIFGRSSTGIKHAKLTENLGDMFKMEHFSEVFKADVVFCCIGTTKAKTPDKETYKKIDYGIPVAAAKLAKANGIDMFIVISALGANPSSTTFYTKVKGEMERDVLKQSIKNTHILQPSLIGGNREEQRGGERIAQRIFKIFDFMIPKKYKMITPETIVEVMVDVAVNGNDTIRITSENISELGN